MDGRTHIVIIVQTIFKGRAIATYSVISDTMLVLISTFPAYILKTYACRKSITHSYLRSGAVTDFSFYVQPFLRVTICDVFHVS